MKNCKSIESDPIDMHRFNKPVELSPGMQVTAEIKTGQRRIIEYLLTPLLRYQNENQREINNERVQRMRSELESVQNSVSL